MDGIREAEEVARARLAFVSAGQRPPAAPRRAVPEPVPRPAVAQPEAPQKRSPSRILEAVRLGPRHIVVIALLLALAIVFAVLAVNRTSATTVPVVEPSPAAPPTQPSSSPEPSMIRVHVAGAVVSPGVVELPDGAIVQDAIAAAGGLAPEADPDLLNLAAPLAEGMQVLIGTSEEPAGELLAGQGAGGAEESGLLDLNRASSEQLQTLPGIGPVSAQAIVDWRDEHGRFASVEELQEVPGIGPKTYAKLAPLVKV